jgi:esterase/lipase
MKKEKKMMRKAALVETGFEDAEIESVLEKFESVNDETFAAMTEMMKMKMKKKKEEEKNSKAEEVKQDLVDVLENVEETTDVALTVGGEDDSQVENTRAALVDFVRARLGKTTK